MSTEYQIVCQVHSEPDGFMQRWPEGGIYGWNMPSLFAVLRNRKAIAELGKDIPELTMILTGAYGDQSLVDFCTAHIDCRCIVLDEYGRKHDNEQ